ncbi:molybdate ABC transporter substrate-binding protein [Dongia rigui]|uniref:Molybdate ABC transporter substrate-binding protein n=1 Tax=Dongia rigui TaxID=940149 RepID=A0ABU5DZ81_9PROT|nr:molybdate ABC transporter substrate-binding protein [Dongia rigui]MDY0872590.1 molybdate ABC transporter substrate-binding protein [Dongia rigui]
MIAFLTRRSLIAAALALSTLAAAPIVAKADDKIVVFAAASLKGPLDDAAAAFKAAKGGDIAISYAGSSALAKQIEGGAPADLFISADLDWMDHVEKAGQVKDGTRSNWLGNTLVLVAPADSALTLKIADGVDLAGAVGDGKLAMADVKAVPAGKYGKASLEKLGAWAAIEPKVAQAENVRAALALVASGEAPLGIVYQTDATAEPKVKVVDTFPEDSHKPIIYPIAQLTGSTAPLAADFLAYLKSPEATVLFEKAGFKILK